MSQSHPVSSSVASARQGPVNPPARCHGIPTAVSADLLMLPSRRLDAVVLALLGLVALLLLWAAVAEVEEVTTGTGRVVPASRIQQVQNLEGGIVREILVQEGRTVAAGDVLLRIDPTQAGSSMGEIREKIDGLRALVARLEAEAEERAFQVPEDLAASRPDLVQHQRTHFETRQSELKSALSVLDLQERQRAQEVLETEARVVTSRRALALAQEELELMRPLLAQKAASRAEILAIESRVNETFGTLEAAELALPRLQAALQEARDRRQERLSTFRSEALRELAAARTELSALSEMIKGSADRLSRTTVRAPVAGIVKTLHVSTPGQVVQPGQDLVEIVPMNDTLLVEARIKPKDIAFLSPGQRALVKLTAYDFSLFGGLEGVVEHIGADSLTDEKGETYYIIRVRTEKGTLTHNSEDLAIIPGMVADVDVRTGSKTVLAYLTKPLTRMRQTALRER